MKSGILFFFLTLLAYFAIGTLRRWLVKQHVVDTPNERSSHSVPTPRGGGLVIVVISLLTAAASLLFAENILQILIFILCGAAIAWIGWQDDLKSLPAKQRFLFQGLVSLVAIFGIGYFEFVTIPLAGKLNFGFLAIPVTFLWIIGMINTYNFMDGIDGISGDVALITALGWLLILALKGQHGSPVFWIVLAIAATNLGFLGHNWHPAKIFIGDAGSTFLGFCFAVIPLLVIDHVEDVLMLAVTMLWVYILDTFVAFARRLIRKERVFSAHRTHVYQRLVISGCRVPVISILYILLTSLGVFLSYAWIKNWAFSGAAIIIGLPVLWILLMGYTKYRELHSAN